MRNIWWHQLGLSLVWFLPLGAMAHSTSLPSQSIDLSPAVTQADTTDLTTANTAALNPTNNDSTIAALSNHLTWRRLLLYPDGQDKSRAPDTQFFISPAGHTNAYAELVANLEALTNPKTSTAYQCQFPARTAWIKAQLPTLSTTPADCPELNEWLALMDARQFSLIHAEEHVNRLGSMMAHTLIKVDTQKSLQTNNNDDANFFNFATDENSQKNIATSSINAFRGRGIGAMTFGRYTDKQAHYLVGDKRDIWQYTLVLPQTQIDTIMRHLWEVKDLKRYYNFLNNNCASEILRLIDVADEHSHLTAKAGRIVAPSEVVRLLNAHGLLKDERFIPSLRTSMGMDLYKAKLTNQHIHFDNAYLTAYEDNAKHNTLTALASSHNNPLHAYLTHRVGVGVRHNNSDNTTTAMLSARGAYQDLLDRQMGKRNYLNVNLMGADIAFDDSQTYIDNITLLDILALNPKNGTTPMASWSGHLKMAHITDASNTQNATHRVASLGAGYGASWLIGTPKPTGEPSDTLCYALANGTAQAGHIYKGYRVGVGAELGCVRHINDKFRLLADAKLPYWYHGGNEGSAEYFQPSIRLGTQYDLGKYQAVRLSYQRDYNHDTTDDSFGLTYFLYFD